MRTEAREETTAIPDATRDTFADDLIMVNGDHYTRAYVDDLRRFRISCAR